MHAILDDRSSFTLVEDDATLNDENKLVRILLDFKNEGFKVTMNIIWHDRLDQDLLEYTVFLNCTKTRKLSPSACDVSYKDSGLRTR